jgi:putative Mn2+ efflux pump MntP
MFEAVVLAFALAMDATAVAATRGLAATRESREGFILPLMFGGFQGGMAAIGWLLGAWGGRYIAAFDHWVAFVLLAGIGTKMAVDGIRHVRRPDEAPAEGDRDGFMLYVLLALATSIDAAAAGITLPLLAVSPWIALALIAVVTAACSAIGFVAGRAVGGPKLVIVGGAVLIGIGVRILVQHL